LWFVLWILGFIETTFHYPIPEGSDVGKNSAKEKLRPVRGAILLTGFAKTGSKHRVTNTKPDRFLKKR
jgi:hypothetical protein